MQSQYFCRICFKKNKKRKKFGDIIFSKRNNAIKTFEKLKIAFSQIPLLRYYNLFLFIRLEINILIYAWEIILSQKFENI